VTNKAPTKQAPTPAKITFLYEFCDEGRLFTFKDLDEILMCRLPKQKDENKFVYLLQCFQKLQGHLYVKQAIPEIAKEVPQIEELLINNFLTLMQCPETFNLSNDIVVVQQPGGNAGGVDPFALLIMGGGGQKEEFGGPDFEFTKMQRDLWEAS